MTRARRQLVISSVQPHVAAESSWWQRLEPFCEPLAVPQESADASLFAQAAAMNFMLPVLPAISVEQPAPLKPARVATPSTAQSRFGEAVHRLLEFHVPAATSWTAAQLQRVQREFSLSPATAEEAARMARRIIGGEGAWAWDPKVVDWQGNEVELLHQGELLRLDRLVRRRESAGGAHEWWVLDFKSASRPERDTDLLAKMRLYREAVARAYPHAKVRAAFLTGQGTLVPVE
jgi:ATP-dependent helicase/nuclease subunit A